MKITRMETLLPRLPEAWMQVADGPVTTPRASGLGVHLNVWYVNTYVEGRSI